MALGKAVVISLVVQHDDWVLLVFPHLGASALTVGVD